MFSTKLRTELVPLFRTVAYAFISRISFSLGFVFIFILFLLIAIVLLPFSILLLIRQLLGSQQSADIEISLPVQPVLDRNVCESLENNLILKRSFKSPIFDENATINGDWEVLPSESGRRGVTKIHSIIARSTRLPKNSSLRPNLVWLHGVGGTATLSFVLSGIIDRIVDDFNVYAVDMPGFGRSTADQSLKWSTGAPNAIL